jgi:hypothetical protein
MDDSTLPEGNLPNPEMKMRKINYPKVEKKSLMRKTKPLNILKAIFPGRKYPNPQYSTKNSC